MASRSVVVSLTSGFSGSACGTKVEDGADKDGKLGSNLPCSVVLADLVEVVLVSDELPVKAE